MNKDDFATARKWLADAPLFIDDTQVERFYDAVVRPDAKLGTSFVEIEETITNKILTEIEGEIQTAGGHLLNIWANIKAKVASKYSTERANQKGKTVQQTFNPIYTSQRQLIYLAEHYQNNLEERAFYVTNAADTKWRSQEVISQVPRELVFLELPGQHEAKKKGVHAVHLIPVAAEFENGKIVPIFTKLRAKNGENPPSEYPENAESPDKLIEERKKYWNWFRNNFRPQAAIFEVEEAAATNGRIRWIDFRLPINNEGETLHLHITPGGDYDTGVFGYNLMRRGLEFGLRIVGTMKSDPDMDVLAIYDR